LAKGPAQMSENGETAAGPVLIMRA
jgi:hypothetical protein